MDAGHFSDLEVLHYFQWPAGATSVNSKKSLIIKEFMFSLIQPSVVVKAEMATAKKFQTLNTLQNNG